MNSRGSISLNFNIKRITSDPGVGISKLSRHQNRKVESTAGRQNKYEKCGCWSAGCAENVSRCPQLITRHNGILVVDCWTPKSYNGLAMTFIKFLMIFYSHLWSRAGFDIDVQAVIHIFAALVDRCYWLVSIATQWHQSILVHPPNAHSTFRFLRHLDYWMVIICKLMFIIWLVW